MRYESRAYGTRQEIIQTLQSRMTASGSARRHEEAGQAIFELQNGATRVVTRDHQFVVEGEPMNYLAGIVQGRGDETEYVKISARSHTEAWRLAHDLPGVCVGLYRDVTHDEI
jgi:hypothetical protein